MSYSIPYDLMADSGDRPGLEEPAARAARKTLGAAIAAYPWSDHLGPYFARVSVAEFRHDIPSAFQFEFGGEEPMPVALSKLTARIDRMIDDLRKGLPPDAD